MSYTIRKGTTKAILGKPYKTLAKAEQAALDRSKTQSMEVWEDGKCIAVYACGERLPD